MSVLSARRVVAGWTIDPLALPKPSRVLRSAEFRSAYRDGIRMTSRYFAAFCLRLDAAGAPARFGFTVPGRSAKQ